MGIGLVLYMADVSIYFCHMEFNSITTAPQITDTDAVYKLWRRTHAGNPESFYKFMTTPTVERNVFVDRLRLRIESDNKVVSVIVD